MGKTVKLNRYQYPLKDANGKTYYGSYTIYDGVKPCGFDGEKLVGSFTVKLGK